MDRREFLKSLAVVAGGLAVGGDVLGAKAGKIGRSNIFFFFADDWGRYASVYKYFRPNGAFQTPNLDRFAREGVRFNNAHVTAPSCTA